MSKLTPLLALATLLSAGAAHAGSGRVVVAPFTGPEPLATDVREVVVELVSARHRLVTAAELDQASESSEADDRAPGAALALARRTGADAVVVGRIAAASDTSYALTLSLLRTRTGQSAGAFLIPLAAAKVTPAARARIELLLGNLLVWIDPEAAPPGMAEPDEEAPPPAAVTAPPATSAQSAPPAAASKDVAKKADEETKGPAWRFPLVFTAGAGLSATSRRLGFAQEAALGFDASLSSNPAPALRLEAEVATIGEPGVAVIATAERSVGAKLAWGDGDGQTLAVAQQQWSLAVRGRTRVRKRWVPMFTVGYSEHSYQVDPQPAGFFVPDANYSFLDLGGGFRYELDVATLFASGRYLYSLATSGITDQASFGSARTSGLAGEAGVEVELLDSILIRAGLRALRFTLDFDGTGVLAAEMDEDLEQDVTSAVDAYVGGYAEAVYRF